MISTAVQSFKCTSLIVSDKLERMDTFTLLEEVQTIARNGLNYTQNPYDRERYERLLELSRENYSELLGAPSAEIQTKFRGELGHITPKLGADAAIFDAQGHILLMNRADGGGWCLPCGFVEPNERPVDTAVRETLEETGLEVRVRRLVGVFTHPANQKTGLHSLSAVVHLCEVLGGKLTLSHEGLELRYWPLEEVPRWAFEHEKEARAAYAMWRSGEVEAVSD